MLFKKTLYTIPPALQDVHTAFMHVVTAGGTLHVFTSEHHSAYVDKHKIRNAV